jgi:hypothetical protein
MKSMEKPKLFISHISEEEELAGILKEHLLDDFIGVVDVFVSSDDRSIEAGSRWLDEVDNALKTAKAELVLCSKESIKSECAALRIRPIRSESCGRNGKCRLWKTIFLKKKP